MLFHTRRGFLVWNYASGLRPGHDPNHTLTLKTEKIINHATNSRYQPIRVQEKKVADTSDEMLEKEILYMLIESKKRK